MSIFNSKLRVSLICQGGVVEALYQGSAKPGNALGLSECPIQVKLKI